jgi:hypothetical protein
VRQCGGDYDLTSDAEVKNVKACELFAVLALQLAGAAALNNERAAFMEAMEALCCAEWLLHNERQEAKYRLIENAMRTTIAYQPTLVRANKEKLEAEISKGVSLRFRQLSSGRNPEHEMWERECIRVYDENRTEFRKKKIELVADKILGFPPFSEMSDPPANTTIRGYIRPHMKQLGDSLPPGKPPKK